MAKDYSPFDFLNAINLTKEDLIGDNENPELIEKQYSGYMVNRGLSYFEDTILHANEMNQRAHLFNRAQFDYYRGALRKRKRFSKWHKAEKDLDLDAIQHVYNCGRTTAKLYLKALSKSDLQSIHSKMETGGVSK